ncbi:MAG: hypothetical protein M2R45_05255 [Verrucomicrobia subdivision 3 bacterium]|nr:hypothetical protein [Limisphaerales bacterium]MCS1416853.1 hypothetical protein [Limisphaerales bacterium]
MINETADLLRFRPKIAQELERALKGYFARCDVKLPTRNPDYEPAKDQGLRTRGR